ncbi:acyl-CoA dehydrogenase family protein [Thalassobacillus sp. C254]|uniref:acyl-CoA dehydrogenase family protein n=1 Tax=Thalassobacillus sp. C254 TaxID=1225341 RepID=UPI0022B6C016|nr:acyl-CoA dehydrogenase family protein [Thalassobacillus sp. C254]
MYNFSPSPEQAEMVQKAERIMEEYVYPNEQYFVPHRGLPENILKPLQQKVKEAGLWAAHLPKKYGGMGSGFLSLGLLSEVIGRSPIAPYIFGPWLLMQEMVRYSYMLQQKHKEKSILNL